MEDPKLYELGNGIQHSDSLEIISQYLPLLESRNTANLKALDIGCGTGNVTWEILHSLLPSNVRLFGSDVEPRMVEFAATKYPELKTFVLDIGTYKLPGHLREAFDYVFSFYCLMWIRDTNTRQAMQNIYNILNPGGQFFTHYLVSHCFFETFHKLSIMEKWKNHVPTNRLVQNFYNFEEENVNDKARNILENVGFKISICRIEFRQAVLNNIEELKNSMAAVLPGYPKVPGNLKEELMNDAVEILFRNEIWKKMNQKSSNKFFIPYRLIIILATKPK